jgi:RNA polymerase sigma-70 factor (ECF subfamily)
MIIDKSARETQLASGVDRRSTALIGVEHAENWSLVRAAQAGDTEAFGQLYDQYVSFVYRFICYRVKDQGLAQDFTSETFLRALRRFSEVNYQGRDIGAWFITIARNIVLDHVKSARFRLELSTADLAPFAPPARDVLGSPELAVLAKLSNERLMVAVNSLNTEQRECVVLRFLNELTVAETAEVMGKNCGAIKALQHRALKRLTALLGDEAM